MIFQTKRLLLIFSGLIICIYILSQAVYSIENSLLQAHADAEHDITACSPYRPDNAMNGEVAKETTHHSQFEAGMIYIQWGQTAYGHCNQQWNKALYDIKTQTNADWIEIPVAFTQESHTSTQVTLLSTTPSVQSFQAGIIAAHQSQYHVFVVPLIGISTGSNRWSGAIHFSTLAEEQDWFDSYWQVYSPYIDAAQKAGAEQLSVGTEDEWLERGVPAALWTNFIAKVRSVYKGMLVYDTNWSSITKPIPSWFADPNLAMIGVSEYISLTDQRSDIYPLNIAHLWEIRVRSVIDAFARNVKKSIFLSEMGYRNGADALYNPWENATMYTASPQLQAVAYNAALSNIARDPYIHGVFFWAWDNVGLFNLQNTMAAKAIRQWYTSALK